MVAHSQGPGSQAGTGKSALYLLFQSHGYIIIGVTTRYYNHLVPAASAPPIIHRNLVNVTLVSIGLVIIHDNIDRWMRSGASQTRGIQIFFRSARSRRCRRTSSRPLDGGPFGIRWTRPSRCPMLHYWVYLGTYIGTYLPASYLARFSHYRLSDGFSHYS